MESSNGFSLAIRSVHEPSNSTSANSSRFPDERTETANNVALSSSSYNSNAPIFSDDVGDNVRQKNISRLPLAVWRTKRSSATCRGDAIAVEDGRRKHEVSRLPASPATSNSRESDFDSLQSAVFHESTARWRRQSYVKPEDRCGRFEWSDNVTEVRRPLQKLGGGNAGKKLERLAVKELKQIKKQKVINAYTGGLNQERSVPTKVGQRTSSYINRKTKERETARINSIMMKKILNAKSTISTQR